MLILSTRRDFSTLRHGETTWHRSAIGNVRMVPQWVADAIDGKRVGLFIHGYNVADAWDAYAAISLEVQSLYDVIIGMTWPGSTLKIGFWPARRRAAESGRRLAAALDGLKPAVLDIQGHSLGCMVALEALTAGLHCRNLILAGAAVGDETLEEGGRYSDAALRATRVLVAYSRRDAVLKRAYRLALWHNALGYSGPRKLDDTPPHVDALNVTAEVPNHGGYKRSPSYFEAWRSMA